mgnify:FL=1
MRSKQLQLNSKVGLYMRLSKDDERAGESLSIENQRIILTKYAQERGWTITDEYIDDGYSGTNFDRPEVQRLLEDAKTGKIDTIIVKDLSRFGRNYIFVGQYVDYIFPMYNIRFIAISDNVDTANTNSAGMDMMPIMNVFNEWHSANTSKKIRAVAEANAKAGKYRSTHAPYGYVKGTGDKCLPVIDEPAASVVRRIFEMRASGKTYKEIYTILNDEKVPIPAVYLFEKFGITNKKPNKNLWADSILRSILKNPMYLGHLVRLRYTTVSYKNKRRVEREPIVFPNAFEPIITQELWDKCRELDESVSHGKHTSWGIMPPLSGLMYCADCGGKMKLGRQDLKPSKAHPEKRSRYHYICGNHSRFGKYYCYNHYIRIEDIEQIVLDDIRSKARLVLEDEDKARADFLKHKEQMSAAQYKSDSKALVQKTKRYEELERLTQSVYEDKVVGKIPEEVCLKLLAKYTEEQYAIKSEIDELEHKLSVVTKNETDVEEFIRRLKHYTNVPELTRELCMELIEYITIGAKPGDKTGTRGIHIYYKLLGKES